MAPFLPFILIALGLYGVAHDAGSKEAHRDRDERERLARLTLELDREKAEKAAAEKAAAKAAKEAEKAAAEKAAAAKEGE